MRSKQQLLPIIAIFIALHCTCRAQNISYRIGIQTSDGDNAGVLPYLTSMSTNFSAMTNGTVRIVFTNDPLPSFPENLTDYGKTVNATLTLSLSAIIGNFTQERALLTNYAALPYYVLSNENASPINSYMLSMAIGSDVLAQVTSQLLNQLSVTSITIIKDEFFALDVLLKYLPALPASITTVTDNFTNYLTALNQSINDSPNNCYVVAITSDNINRYMIPIMEAALYLGQLRSTKKWIIHSLYYELDTLTAYASSGVSIYSLSYDIADAGTALRYYAQDSVQHFIMATKSGTSLRSQITTGITGNVEFDSAGYRKNLNIKIVQADSLGSLVTGSAVYGSGSVSISLNIDRRKLKNINVRVAYFLMSPYVSNNSVEFYGMGIEILKKMMANLTFTVTYVPLVVRSNATIQDDIVDMLAKDKADFSIMPIEYTASRAALVEFTSDIISSSISVLGSKPRVSLSFTWLLQAYTYNVWIGIVAALLFLSLIFWASDKISPNKMEGFHGYSFSHSCLIVFSSPFMAKLETKPMRPSARIFAILLWFGSLMLMATYISSMVAFCIKPDPDYRFTNFDQLIDIYATYGYKFLFIKNYTATEKLRASPNGSQLLQIAQTQTPSSMYVESMNDVIGRLKNDSQLFFIGDHLFVQYGTYQDCSLGMVAVQEQMYSAALAINKNFIGVETLKNMVQYLITSQEFARQQRIWYESGICAQSNTAYQRITVRPLDVSIMTGLFASIAAVIAVACIIGFIEYSHKKIALCWRLRDVKQLEFGKVYAAKIEEIEHDGVWVRVNDRPRSYFLHNCHLNNDPMRIFTAEDLHLRVDDVIQVKYFGKDPTGGAKRFMRDESEI